ncbi:MAG: adenylyl-sulfate kinase [Phycisphaerales bacterium]
MSETDRPREAASPDVVWDAGTCPRTERERLLGQRAATLWMTGISGSGKSTVAAALERRLVEGGRLVYRLDGDNLRHGLNADLGFSAEDRAENIRRAGEVCRLLADTGAIVVATFISPFTKDRLACRRVHEAAGIPFLEAHVHCPLEVAESRDPKGLYKKARGGGIAHFTGIGQEYEPPTDAEIDLDTSRSSIDESVDRLIAALRTRELIDG